MRDLEMRISDRAKPKGIASGNATSTIESDIRKPLKTIGRLWTKMTGFRNRRRNILEFHASTHGCSLRSARKLSNAVTPLISTGGILEIFLVEPSASV